MPQNYNQNPVDRLSIDARESVFGHLLLEKGWPLAQALRYLAPTVAAHRKGAALASSVTLTTAIGGGLFAIGGFAFLGIGWAIPAAIGAAYNFLSHSQGKDEAIRREAEYLLHLQHPGLSKLLWDLHQKGMGLDTLVCGYDRIVDSVQMGLQDPRGNRYLDEASIAALMQSAIESDRNLSAATVLGATAAAPLPPTQIEPPAVATGNRKEPTATNDATLRVGNQPSELQAVDRTSPTVSSVPAAPRSIDELQARLKAECPALLRLVKAHPIRLVGIQRTGKSTLAKLLALLRLLLIPEHRVLAATPHHEPDNPYPSLFQVVGHRGSGRRDTAEIESAWNQVQGAIDKNQHFNLTPIWDEFGGYGDFFEDSEALTLSLRSMLRESIKHGIHPVFVLHGESAQFISGGNGLIRALLQGTVRVETIGEQIDDFGTMAPTGKAKIKWLDGSKEDLALPNWLDAELLMELLKATGHTPRHLTELKQTRLQLETLWQSPAAQPTGHPEGKPPDTTTEATEATDPIETAILEFLKTRPDGATAGRIRADKKALKSVPSEEIECYLSVLTAEGKVRQEGNIFYYQPSSVDP